MDPSYFEVEPNRIAEHYRNYQNTPSSAQIEKHLDVIEISEDGAVLLGTSNLCDRYWNGSVFYFNALEDVPDKSKSIAGIECGSGVTGVKFLASKEQFLVTEDTGTISILGLTKALNEKTPQTIILQSSSTEHDDSISSVSLFPNKTRIVTGGMDSCIKVWDAGSLQTEHTYRPAHSQGVLSVSAHSNEHIFASGSLDHCALMWDIRQDKPAKLVLESEVPITAVAWQPKDTTILAVGSANGLVQLMDTRQGKGELLGQAEPFQHSVHRLCFAPDRPNLLAACADCSTIVVLDCTTASQPSVTYKDDRHEDFVRGLSWNPQNRDLVSCGWDKSVLKHEISTN